MSAESIQDFIQAIRENEELRSTVKSAGADLTRVLEIANQAGFAVNEDDFEALELTEEQLRQVEGGAAMAEYAVILAGG